MSDRFEWLEQQIIYREARQRDDAEELRWLLVRERIRDRQSGDLFQRTLLRHPGVAAIVPINGSGELLLIEQFRYSAGRPLWEIPAGTLHGEQRDGRVVAAEAPETAALRELAEEAGLTAGRLKKLQSFYAMPGTSDGIVHLFLAFELAPCAASADIGEIVTKVQPFTMARALEMIAAGEICDAKTIIGIYGARDYQERV